jgi:AcrR family transcriptional regulator
MRMKIDLAKILKIKTPLDGINPKKREKIIIAAIDEFADVGFELASTNRIAKRAGIAKGALFKYFKTKEKLFLAITDDLLRGLIGYLMKRVTENKKDILELYINAVEELYTYFKGNLKMFKFFKMIMTERAGEVYIKLRKKWEPLMEPMLAAFMKGVDTSNLSISVPELAKLFMWLDAGLDTDMMAAVTPNTTVDEMLKLYRKNLAIVEKVLKNGIYK